MSAQSSCSPLERSLHCLPLKGKQMRLAAEFTLSGVDRLTQLEAWRGFAYNKP